MANELKSIKVFADRFLSGGAKAEPTRKTPRGGDLYEGFTLANLNEVGAYVLCECPGFTEREAWRDGQYLAVWTNGDVGMTITYCEGDIHVVVCHTHEVYMDELAHAERFYKQGV